MKAIRNYGIDVISALFILLFVYAAFSKALDVETFQVQLGQSPVIGTYAEFISYGILIFEFIVALLLGLTRTRLLGFYGALSLMIMFTVYIIIIMHFAPFTPCSCGGILDDMGWKEHLVFNVFFLLLSILAFIIYYKDIKLYAMILTLFLSFSIPILLYTISETKYLDRGNFIRNYKWSLEMNKSYTLKNFNFYFIGYHDCKVYFGDTQAPLYVYLYDLENDKWEEKKIILDDYELPFRSVRIQINYPHFYVIDGTIPIVYQGKIDEWKAIRMHELFNDLYFSKSLITNNNLFVFRNLNSKTRKFTIGYQNLIDPNDRLITTELFNEYDNVFEQDGILLYDSLLEQLIYVFYYLNHYVVISPGLDQYTKEFTIVTNAENTFETIRTGTKVQLKSYIPIKNRLASVSGGKLIINSNELSQYDDPKDLKTHSIFDIYDYRTSKYFMSFKIPISKYQVKDILSTENYFFSIIGNEFRIYELKHQLAN